MSNNRQDRDLDLLKKSLDALETEQRERTNEPARGARKKVDVADDDHVVMYRGRPVRRKRAGSVPGSNGSSGRGSRPGGKKSGGTSSDAVKAALVKLTELYSEGLITKADYDSKKRQVLDRL